MNAAKKEKMDKELAKVGLKAILKSKKVKLYAKVNHEDNFALHLAPVAHQAIIEDVSLLLTPDEIDWLNIMCEKERGKSVDKLDGFCLTIARQAYHQLRA